MDRFFSDEIGNGAAYIRGDDVSHIARVLRLKAGDPVVISDGRGTDYRGEIARVEKALVTVRVFDPSPSIPEPPAAVTLFQCLPKQGKMETILQKCTELGVFAFVPVESGRCMAGLARGYESKLERLSRVAREAARQSRRGSVPAVQPLVRIADIDVSRFDLFCIPYEEAEETTLKAALRAHPGARSVGLLIGPEGGFSRQELLPLLENGAVAVTLGPRILRTETAGMAALAQILYEVMP